MRATRACERLVEKVEAAKLRTVRLKERRRQFSLLLDVQSQLDALENCGKFAQLVREQAPDLRGCTVLVPTDDAFLGDDDAFEDDCWGVHVIDGPWKMGDMAAAGRVLGRHVDTRSDGFASEAHVISREEGKVEWPAEGVPDAADDQDEDGPVQRDDHPLDRYAHDARQDGRRVVPDGLLLGRDDVRLPC